jgi:hypothetical protein
VAALIELAIVIAGILIALAVSNWNENRLDQDRAAHFLQRIHGDLLTDRRNIDTTLAFWTRVAHYGDIAIASGESGRPAEGPVWNTVLAWYQASQTMPYTATDTTFEEMRSSGDLGLIADETLRAALAEFYRQSSEKGLGRILQHDPAYRTQIRAITPWATQRYIWEHCFSESSYFGQTLVDCPSPMSDEEAAALLGTYQRTPALLDNLRTWMTLLHISAIVLRNTRGTAEQIIAQTDAATR